MFRDRRARVHLTSDRLSYFLLRDKCLWLVEIGMKTTFGRSAIVPFVPVISVMSNFKNVLVVVTATKFLT